MNEDDQLVSKVRAVLQDVIPEPPTGGSLLVGARVRVRRRRRMMATGASLGVAAIAAAVIVPTTLLRTGTDEPTAPGKTPVSSSVSHPSKPAQTDAAPAWSARCFSSWTADMGLPPASATPYGRRALQFVGMSRDAIEQQAAEEHYRVVIVGSDGHCRPWVVDLVYTHHVYLAFDTHDRVVAAREDGWGIPSH